MVADVFKPGIWEAESLSRQCVGLFNFIIVFLESQKGSQVS